MSESITFDVEYFSNATIRLHINAAITIIFDLFVGYLVLYKSPRSMGSYKYYLLNTIVSALVLDLHLALIFVPVPLFPAAVICSEGLMKGYGRLIGAEIHLPIYVLLYGVNTCAVLLAFAYRYFLLRSHSTALKSKRGIFLTAIIYFIYTIPTSIMFLLVSDARGALILKEKYPSIFKVYESRTCFTGDMGDPFFIATLSLTLALIGLSFFIATVIALKIFRILQSQKQAMSEKTFQMHQKMLWSLIVQIIVPSFSLILPASTMIIVAFQESYQAKWINPYIFQIGSTHSILNCLMLIILIKPYRIACLKLIFCGNKKLLQKVTNVPFSTLTNPLRIPSTPNSILHHPHSRHDLKVDQNTQNFITEKEKMNENYKYIFFAENIQSNMPQIYPKNGIPLSECLTLTDPPTSATATSTAAADNDASKEPSSSKSPTPAAGAAITLNPDEENEGPQCLTFTDPPTTTFTDTDMDASRESSSSKSLTTTSYYNSMLFKNVTVS